MSVETFPIFFPNSSKIPKRENSYIYRFYRLFPDFIKTPAKVSRVRLSRIDNTGGYFIVSPLLCIGEPELTDKLPKRLFSLIGKTRMDKNEKNGHEIDDTTRPIDGVCVRQCDHLESDDASEKENFGDEAKANPSETVQSSVDNEESDGTFHAGNQSNSASKKAGRVEQFRTDQQVCDAVVGVGRSEENQNQTDEQVNMPRFSNTQQEEERIRRLYNEQMVIKAANCVVVFDLIGIIIIDFTNLYTNGRKIIIQ